MVIRVVNPNTAQAWLPSGFHVVRTSQSDEAVIAGAATCARGTEDWMWLASSTAFLRRVTFQAEAAALPLDLDDHFLSSVFETDPFPHSDLAVSLDIGDLHSISTATTGSAGDNADSGCDCVVEVFGVKGYAMVGAHDGVVRESCSFLWQNATDAMAFAETMQCGPLRNAIVQPSFSSSALITIGATGMIRASAGSNYFNVRSHMTHGSGLKIIVNMSQTPVWVMSDPGRNFLVVLGCFRAGIVLFANKEGVLSASRFVLQGGSERLTRYSVIVLEEEDSHLVFEEISGHRTDVSYDREAASIRIDLDCDRKLIMAKGKVETEDQSSTLRNLLQGIETLGEREKLHDSDCKSLEEIISSYNAALLFVTEWKEKRTSETAMDIEEDSCRISVDLASTGGSPRLQLPNPLVGREIFITVSFRNSTGITLGDGWMLRLRLRKENDSMTHDISQARVMDKGNIFNEKINSRISRFMTCPVEKIEPGAAKSVSFPVVIDSHAPLHISIALAFHHPTTFALSDEHIDVEVSLQNDVVLDILHFARRSGNKDIKDSSHELLGSSQLMGYFNRDVVERQRGYPTVSRFEVPFPPCDVRGILDFVEASASFETPLGAQFSISVADVALRDETKTRQTYASSITLRGVPHVLPFLRAALLRRLLNSVAQKSNSVSKIVVRDRTNIKYWQNSLVDTADKSLPLLRTAETRLVEALRMYHEIAENGCIEHCFNSQERETMLAALQSARTAYGTWRRENERFWTPKGATYVGKQPEPP